MNRAGREPDWSRVAAAGVLLLEAFDPPPPTPVEPLVTTRLPATTRPSLSESTPTPRSAPPSPTATARPLSSATAVPGSVEYVLTRQELDAELKRAMGSVGMPLRDAALRLVPNDRVALTGQLPVAIFLVPVELEARVALDDRGRVTVRTTRVQAIGAELPDGVAQALGTQIDEQGTQAVRSALPSDARARGVRVEAERIVVDLAPT
jgi:hypothetical protein